jgi:hypothetical protein
MRTGGPGGTDSTPSENGPGVTGLLIEIRARLKSQQKRGQCHDYPRDH